MRTGMALRSTVGTTKRWMTSACLAAALATGRYAGQTVQTRPTLCTSKVRMAGPAAHTITVPVRFVSQVRAIVLESLCHRHRQSQSPRQTADVSTMFWMLAVHLFVDQNLRRTWSVQQIQPYAAMPDLCCASSECRVAACCRTKAALRTVQGRCSTIRNSALIVGT